MEQTGNGTMIVLANDRVIVEVAPSFGAKIVRIFDRGANREWAWSAREDRRLHGNRVGDGFETSPLVGVDECIPTIGACSIDSTAMPDHGEAWSRSWEIEARDDERMCVTTRIDLSTIPLRLRRTVSLHAATIRLDYEATNLSDRSITYIWALHPLLAMRDGDEIVFPADVGVGRVESVAGLDGLSAGMPCAWPAPVSDVRLDRLLSGCDSAAIKAFLPTPADASIAVRNDRDGSRLRLRYGPAEALPFVGVWISRGGWNGHHHFAIEPTNADRDRLDELPTPGLSAVTLGARGRRTWFVTLELV